ncbi:MAG: cholesterol esterase [Chaenotheca gracillima]|nr:MAG: cholesterol esterase [Chaenotheca gracillima]
MSQPDPSLFPKFADGDVSILITNNKSYQLHSNVLRQNSDELNRLLVEDQAASITPKQKREGRVLRYWLNLRRFDDDVGRFELGDIKSSGYSFGFFEELENGRARRNLHKHYNNLFGAYYNIHPEIDETNIATVLEDSMGLIDVAERLGSMSVVSESIDIALLRQGQVLFGSIANNAPAWSDLACRLKSPSIFSEVIIHLVGQWQSINEADRAELNQSVRSLCERKFAELEIRKQATEVRMMGHYPNSLQRPEDPLPGRTTYSNDIYGWMSICIFRHWYTQCHLEKRGRTAKDGGAALYRQVGAGGFVYLTRPDMHNFHRLFPMSGKGMRSLENTLLTYKEELKPFVGYLLRHRSQLDVSKKPLGYLTCCDVTREDFPWIENPTK